MKKYLLCLGFIMLALLIISIPKTYGLENNSYIIDINSNDLLNYIKENKINNIKKICVQDYCDYLRSPNINKAIAIFNDKVIAKIKEENSLEASLEARVKGFKVTKIELFN